MTETSSTTTSNPPDTMSRRTFIERAGQVLTLPPAAKIARQIEQTAEIGGSLLAGLINFRERLHHPGSIEDNKFTIDLNNIETADQLAQQIPNNWIGLSKRVPGAQALNCIFPDNSLVAQKLSDRENQDSVEYQLRFAKQLLQNPCRYLHPLIIPELPLGETAIKIAQRNSKPRYYRCRQESIVEVPIQIPLIELENQRGNQFLARYDIFGTMQADNTFPELFMPDDWVTDALRNSWPYLQQSCDRHGVDIAQVASLAIQENRSNLNRPIQNALNTNLWQDITAFILNNHRNIMALGVLRSLSSKSQEIFQALATAQDSDFNIGNILHSTDTYIALMQILALIASSITQPQFKGPESGLTWINIPPFLQDILGNTFESVERRKEGIHMERSIGIAALKPHEVYDIIFDSDPPITIYNPYSGKPISRNRWKQWSRGALGETTLSLLLMDPTWNLEFAAACIAKAGNPRKYEEYRQQFNAHWQLDSTNPAYLPIWQNLEPTYRSWFIKWSAGILKSYPEKIVENFGQPYDFRSHEDYQTESIHASDHRLIDFLTNYWIRHYMNDQRGNIYVGFPYLQGHYYPSELLPRQSR